MWPDSDYIPIGSARLKLPDARAEENVKLAISGGYIYTAAEGSAAPIPPRGSTTLELRVIEKS